MAKFVSVLDRMRDDWDRKAREDALGHACPAMRGQDVAAFFQSGRHLVRAVVGAEVAAWPPNGERSALEIGCGPGRLLRPLAELFAEVHGVDVSGEMLRVATDLLGGEERIRLHLSDGMTLRCLRRTEFDFILSYDTLSHLPDRALLVYLLRQARRHLKQDGLFLFALDARRDAEAELPRALERAGLRLQKSASMDNDLWIWARRA